MKDRKLYLEIINRLGQAENILDIGCGEGELCNYLAKTTGKRVTGLDIKGAGFGKAKKMAAKIKIPNLVECVEGKAGNMSCFKDNGFDATTMAYTLHHIEHGEEAVLEIKRVLKPEGRLIVADYIIEEKSKADECHKYFLSDIVSLIRKAGFRLLESKQLEPDLALVAAEKLGGH